LKWTSSITIVGLAVAIGFIYLAGTSDSSSTAALEVSCAQKAAALDLQGLGKALMGSEEASFAERGAAAGLHVLLWEGDCRNIRDTEAQQQCTTKANNTLLHLGEKLLQMSLVAANPADEAARTEVREFVYKGCLADPNRDNWTPPALRPVIAASRREANIREFRAQLDLFHPHDQFQTTAVDLEDGVEKLIRSGVSPDDAFRSILIVVQSPGINPAMAYTIADTARRMSAVKRGEITGPR
jgi:hypothetical protein